MHTRQEGSSSQVSHLHWGEVLSDVCSVYFQTQILPTALNYPIPDTENLPLQFATTSYLELASKAIGFETQFIQVFLFQILDESPHDSHLTPT